MLFRLHQALSIPSKSIEDSDIKDPDATATELLPKFDLGATVDNSEVIKSLNQLEGYQVLSKLDRKLLFGVFGYLDDNPTKQASCNPSEEIGELPQTTNNS